jgi:two-component system, NarL family, sensor kinase
MEKWQDPNVIALWIAISVVLVVTILLFVVKIMHSGYKRMMQANLRQARLQVEHQKKLVETALVAQERERTRIAADLHDGLIGRLTLVRMKSQVGAAPAEVEILLGDSIAEARRISHDLTPPLLDFSPMHELLDNLLDPWQQKLEIYYRQDVRAQVSLTPEQKIQLLRIAQELLTNVIKHSGATLLQVNYRQTQKSIILLYKDNGRGFDTALLKNGLGLNSLEMRAQYLNGHYRLHSAPGRGTRAIFAIALDNACINNQ